MTSIGVGVREVRIQLGRSFRVIYLAKFKDAVYVLHAFKKKTQKTSGKDIAISRQRYQELLSRQKEEKP
jgi:phage-related protein